MDILFTTQFSQHHAGALLAMIASCCWTFAPFLLASAVRSIGPYYANFWRLVMASGALCLVALAAFVVSPGIIGGITASSIQWMALSGITGLVIGDSFYFGALKYLGPRRTLQVLAATPIASALGAFLFLEERLSFFAVIGIVLTVGAILAINLFDRKEAATAEPGSFSYAGLGLALLGMVCQGAGAVLMRKAYLCAGELNPVVATAIRISAAGIAIVVLALVSGKISGAVKAVPSAKAFGRLVCGTALGPVVGMLFYIASLKFAPAGIASAMSSLSPILIVPLTAWRYKLQLNRPALIAMLIAAGGVMLIFYR